MSKSLRNPWFGPHHRPGNPGISSGFPTSQTVLSHPWSSVLALPSSPAATQRASLRGQGRADVDPQTCCCYPEHVSDHAAGQLVWGLSLCKLLHTTLSAMTCSPSTAGPSLSRLTLPVSLVPALSTAHSLPHSFIFSTSSSHSFVTAALQTAVCHTGDTHTHTHTHTTQTAQHTNIHCNELLVWFKVSGF